MSQTKSIDERIREDEIIIRLGLSNLSPVAKEVGAAILIFRGETRQAVLERSVRILKRSPEEIVRSFSELAQANVIATNVTGKPENGFYVLETRMWRIPGERKTSVRRRNRR